jgi:hypothetical protein
MFNLNSLVGGDEWTTIFTSGYRYYEYIVMRFEKPDASESFQSMVYIIFTDMIIDVIGDFENIYITK